MQQTSVHSTARKYWLCLTLLWERTHHSFCLMIMRLIFLEMLDLSSSSAVKGQALADRIFLKPQMKTMYMYHDAIIFL